MFNECNPAHGGCSWDKGKVHVTNRRLEDVREEGAWNTVGAVGDVAATVVGALPNPAAKALAITIDGADIVSIQSRHVMIGQNYVNETYEYDTLYDSSAPQNWVEYPGVRRNPILIKSDTETIWRSRKTEYRTCLSHNFGCSN